jgi:hypothetical protein
LSKAYARPDLERDGCSDARAAALEDARFGRIDCPDLLGRGKVTHRDSPSRQE